MERVVYDRMSDLEMHHWWFVARRKIIAKLIGSISRGQRSLSILEAGCGSGGNLTLLQKFGNVDAFEFDERARETARKRSGLDIEFGALPDDLPRLDRPYDLIGVFDVLEHIEDDVGSLSALAALLEDEGQILVTVPAFPWLWSQHDVRHHHFRRYTRASLEAAAKKAGLEVTRSTYFNTFLFPVAIVGRTVKKLLGRQTPDDQMPPNWLNALLTQIFQAESHVIGHMRFPFGLSLAVVLERPNGS